MVVSKKYCQIFSWILICIQITVTVGEKCRMMDYPGDIQNFFGDRCCHGEEFDYSHLRPLVAECVVPPTNPSLSMEDSYWKLFGCMVTKALHPKPLTLVNFIELMTKDWENVTRHKFIERLLRHDATTLLTTSVSNNDLERDDFNSLRQMWELYFEAEAEFCVDNGRNIDSNPMSFVAHFERPFPRYLWYPVTVCGNSSYPNIYTGEPKHEKFFGCISTLGSVFNSNNFTTDESICIEVACRRIAVYGEITMEEMKGDLNFENELKNSIPKLLSKSVQESIFEIMMDQVGSSVFNMTALISSARNRSSTYMDEHEIHPEMRKFCTNAITVDELSNSFDEAKYKFCRQ